MGNTDKEKEKKPFHIQYQKMQVCLKQPRLAYPYFFKEKS